MVRAIRCHRQNMKTSIINGSEVSRLSVAIQSWIPRLSRISAASHHRLKAKRQQQAAPPELSLPWNVNAMPAWNKSRQAGWLAAGRGRSLFQRNLPQVKESPWLESSVWIEQLEGTVLAFLRWYIAECCHIPLDPFVGLLHRPVPVNLAQFLDKPLCGYGLPAIRFLLYVVDTGRLLHHAMPEMFLTKSLITFQDASADDFPLRTVAALVSGLPGFVLAPALAFVLFAVAWRVCGCRSTAANTAGFGGSWRHWKSLFDGVRPICGILLWQEPLLKIDPVRFCHVIFIYL